MSATAIPTLPTLDQSPAPERSRLQDWSNWFIQPSVLIRVVMYLTTLIYLRTVLFDYVYDDNILITLNPWMESWKQVPQLLTHSFWGFLDIPRAIDFYRPLVSLVFAVIRHLLGPAPGWFHLVAAGLHIWATYLVYRLACETVLNRRIGAIAAGLFGLHPTKVETAAWISGISDSLSVVFFLAAMIWYFKARNGGNRSVRYRSLSALLLLLALFSKEAAVFAPVLIAIYESNSANSSFRDRCLAGLRAALPFFGVTALAVIARKALIRNEIGQAISHIPLKFTILTAPKSILWYVLKQIWPGELSVQYPLMIVRSISFSQFILPLIVLLALTTSVVFAVRRKPTGIFFFSWFVLMLAPVIVYFITLQEHDRYSYLASVASSIGLAYLVERVRQLSVLTHSVVILALFGLMAAMTVNYESYWDNDITLFERAVTIAPDNWNAQEYLANTYVTYGQKNKAEAFARSIIDRDHSPESWCLLGNVFLAESKYEQARDAMLMALKLWGPGRHLMANLGLANADIALNRTDEAIQIYDTLISEYPNRGFIHGYLATALKSMGRKEEAEQHLAIQKSLRP